MLYIVLLISIAACVLAGVLYGKLGSLRKELDALKASKPATQTTTASVDIPMEYDEKTTTFTLKGNLRVKGSVTADKTK